ncbi:hypothetical protein MKX03_016715, partial [Papaver bracteatum]
KDKALLNLWNSFSNWLEEVGDGSDHGGYYILKPRICRVPSNTGCKQGIELLMMDLLVVVEL